MGFIAACLTLLYGFPYMLAIPTVWDIAKRNTVKRLNSSSVHVQDIDSIEDASSIDYLCIQSIGVLDDDEKLDQYRASIRRLQDMGIKVILATGIKAEDAKQIALRTGILSRDHQNICGSVIEGQDLRKLYYGR